MCGSTEKCRTRRLILNFSRIISFSFIKQKYLKQLLKNSKIKRNVLLRN